jgi:ribosome-binding ATPase YchF (GTP1/OBG family)
MQIGIIGKPNVGKSSFFKAITFIDVKVENRPFTTISPNFGIGYIRVNEVGKELGVVSNPRNGFIKGNYRFVPIELIDVPGLVPNAHLGKGLGNKFLDDLRKANGFVLIIDISGSTDENGNYVGKNCFDPLKDVEFVINEIDMWIFQILKRNLERNIKRIKSEKRKISEEISKIVSGLEIKREDVEKCLKELKIDEHFYDFDDEIILKIAKKLRETKKFVIAANKIDVDIDLAKENIKKIKKVYENVIPISCLAEIFLKELEKQGKIDYVYGTDEVKIKNELNEKEKKAMEIIKQILDEFKNTGVYQTLEHLIFNLLEYIPVFPVGEKLKDKEGRILPDCFLVKKGTKVIELAEMIHSDLAKNFVKAIEVKSKNFVGKDYELKPYDVIQIISSK